VKTRHTKIQAYIRAWSRIRNLWSPCLNGPRPYTLWTLL